MKLALRHYMAGLCILSIVLYVPLSEGLALISQNPQFDDDLVVTKASIIATRKDVFGKENMILQPITPQQERAWRHMLEGANGQLGLKGFVDIYAPRFSNDYVTICHASTALFNADKLIFNRYVLAVLRHPDHFQGLEWPDPKKINLEDLDLNGIDGQLQKIEATKEMLEAMRADLQGRWFVFGRHKVVADVLIKVEGMLVAAMDKAREDYKILKATCQEHSEEQSGVRRPRLR
jgi:hypothetical protein